MKANLKTTALAAAVAMFAAGAAHAAPPMADVNTRVNTDINIEGDIEAVGEVEVSGELVVGGNINLDYSYDYNDTFNREYNDTTNIEYNDVSNIEYNDTTNIEYNDTVTYNDEYNTTVNQTLDQTVTIDQSLTEDYSDTVSYNEEYNTTVNQTLDQTVTIDQSLTEDYTTTVNQALDQNIDIDQSLTETRTIESNDVTENIVRNEYGRIDVQGERNVHGREVLLSKDLSLESDVAFTGDIELTGELEVDSAAIAVVDGRQVNTDNEGYNEMLENEAEMSGDAASGASGNLGFNVAAGDNNLQDNAAALSAADAGFSFGLADAEIFNSQAGAANTTWNEGVSNASSLDGNAFSGAEGNIQVNIASGNNNAQRNSLSASVAVAGYSTASVASDQVSTGNWTSNAGVFETEATTLQFNLTGAITGNADSMARYEETGMSYQHENFYPSTWGAEGGGDHPSSPRLGHVDFDIDSQGATPNPVRAGELDEFGQERGGLAFDNVNEGMIDLSDLELEASLTGSVTMPMQVAMAATNSASVSGSAFSGATGNINVNLAAGTGNLQSNSLSLAVAQPGAGGGGGGGGGGGAGPGG